MADFRGRPCIILWAFSVSWNSEWTEASTHVYHHLTTDLLRLDVEKSFAIRLTKAAKLRYIGLPLSRVNA